jgi:HD superfamily phosphohydrolase
MDTSRFNHKRISDPIHGTFGLSELEVKVVDSKVFQRLRNVKQLGLAHYVFPGADYSRFSHSIGVCHITGRILGSLRDKRVPIEDKEFQLYRLAALLHDVGHYPFSHTTEEPIDNHYKQAMIVSKAEQANAEVSEEIGKKPSSLNHELVGREILLNDPELNSILKDEYQPKQIYSIILRDSPTLYGNLVSSDLDADRCDFMLRSAHFSGLPYGSADIDYLVSQVELDSSNRLCLSAKALRTADHFLLCRYFDYQQIPFNKTVTAFELVLKDVIATLLKEGRIDCSATAVSKRISEDQWFGFDDRFILDKIKELYDASDPASVEAAKAKAILTRNAPKLLGEIQKLKRREKSEEKEFLGQREAVKQRLDSWARTFDIDRSRWYLWEPAAMVLTKIGSRIPVSAVITGDEDKDKYHQSIRILNRAGTDSIPIVESPDSLMSIMSDYGLYSLRVYVLFPEGQESKRAAISEYISKDLPFQWK